MLAESWDIEHRRHPDQAQPAPGRAVPHRSRDDQRRRQVQPACALPIPRSPPPSTRAWLRGSAASTRPTNTPLIFQLGPAAADRLRPSRVPQHRRQGHARGSRRQDHSRRHRCRSSSSSGSQGDHITLTQEPELLAVGQAVPGRHPDPDLARSAGDGDPARGGRHGYRPAAEPDRLQPPQDQSQLPGLVGSARPARTTKRAST